MNLTREIPDYVGHKGDSDRLCARIRNVHLRHGRPWVKVWTERRWANGTNGELKAFYDIRSNIGFDELGDMYMKRDVERSYDCPRESL